MKFEDELSERIAREADRRLLNAALEGLRNAKSPLLRSMADDLRSGRVSLSELARQPEVAASFETVVARYKRWHEGLSPKEREMLLTEAKHRVGAMRRRVADEYADEYADDEARPDGRAVRHGE
jgi:hypothetical protein